MNWAVLSDEQMSNGYPFSLLNDEQMSNKVGVEHQPVKHPSSFFVCFHCDINKIQSSYCPKGSFSSYTVVRGTHFDKCTKVSSSYLRGTKHGGGLY